MEFEVRTTLQEEDVRAYVKAWRSWNRAGCTIANVWLVAPLIGAIVLLIGLFLTAPVFWRYSQFRVIWGVSLAMVGIGVALSLPICFQNVGRRAQERSMWENCQKNGLIEQYYTFRDTDFLLSGSDVDWRKNYSMVQKVVESPKYFFLFDTHNAVHILPKRDFTQGDPAAFGPFIAEKCGKEIIQIK